MRLTMKNHANNTYRASLIRQDNNCVIGDVVNKLGRYEDICEEPEELEKLIKEQKKEPTGKSKFLVQKLHIYIIASSPRESKKNSG